MESRGRAGRWLNQPGGRATLGNANSAREWRRSGAVGPLAKKDGGDVRRAAATLGAPETMVPCGRLLVHVVLS